MPGFSQMPTLGEFIEAAKSYGYSKRTITVPSLGRIKYLRRERNPGAPELVDLPPMPESRRLTRAGVLSLCARSGILKEDFGL